MKSKRLIFLIVVLLLFIIIGIGFIYSTFSKEPVLEDEEMQLAKSNSKIKNNSNDLSSQNKQKNNSHQKSKNNQLVVDQILQSSVPKEVKVSEDKNILGAENEKINLEITIFDGEQNKRLTDFELEYKFIFDYEHKNYEKIRTDQNGKIIISSTQAGYYTIQLKTAIYAVHYNVIPLRYGKNEYVAKLFIGGTIEIRATNSENKIVNGLSFKYRGDLLSDDHLIKFDIERGVYVMPNMAIGANHIVFMAPNYRETEEYIVRVDSNKVAFLEVRMEPSRIIYFDLDIDNKPKSIELIETSTYLFLFYRFPPKARHARKNKNDLYELVVNDLQVDTLVISLDQYVSKNIYLFENIDFYKVSMEKAFTGQIQINNEKGKPVVGAIVSYASQTQPKSKAYYQEFHFGGGKHHTRDPFLNKPISDESGMVILTGLKEEMQLEFSVAHENYTAFEDEWMYNAYTDKIKTIVLLEGNSISGKITSDGKIVVGATLELSLNGGSVSDNWKTSDAEGRFYFNNLNKKENGAYTIKAAHRNFGVAVSSEINAKELPSNIELKLVPEKSLSILLVDNLSAPLPNKKIEIYNNRSQNFNAIIKTDENGKFELFNFLHDYYRVELFDDENVLKYINIEIPASETVIMATPKYIKKIFVKDNKGIAFPGELKIELTGNYWLNNVVKEKSGFCLIEFHGEDDDIRGMILIEAPGFAYSYLGPFEKAKDIPAINEVELAKGENIKITVKDELENNPIPFAMVDISIFNRIILSKSTNELGEVFFENLNNKFEINVKKRGYAEYTEQMEMPSSKELTINLIKGGCINGHFTLDKNVDNALVTLRPYVKGNKEVPIFMDGKFEFKNLLPGKYDIKVVKKLINNQNKTESFQTEVVVINEQTLEINLDQHKIK